MWRYPSTPPGAISRFKLGRLAGFFHSIPRHKYWSGFSKENAEKIESAAGEFFKILFEPEVREPLKTIDVPIGGSVSPVDALALLVDFLEIAGTRESKPKAIDEYADDDSGDETLKAIKRATEIVGRITGNSPASLGLHPAVYFYNERGKYSRFLFLGMATLITDKVKNNDGKFFQKFTKARKEIESFLMANKSLIGILLQNLGKNMRVPKMRDLLEFLVNEVNLGNTLTPEGAIKHLGLRGRIIDVVGVQTSPHVSDETKSTVLVRQALDAALVCPICKGKLDPKKSVSYDHIVRVRDGGSGSSENVQLVHPFCNSGVKN